MGNDPPQDDAKRRWWSRLRMPWIVLHFLFVASLCVVYVRREPWIFEGRRPLPEVPGGSFGRRFGGPRHRITSEELLHKLRTHDMKKQGLDALDFSPDGSQALARDVHSDELVIYDLEARKEISRPMPTERVGAASYLPDGKGILLVDFCGGWIGGWDTPSHRLDYRLRIAGNTGMCLSVSPDGRLRLQR